MANTKVTNVPMSCELYLERRSFVGGSSTVLIKDLREVPIITGRFRFFNLLNRFIISRLCLGVFPNPIPGSIIMLLSSIPDFISNSILSLI